MQGAMAAPSVAPVTRQISRRAAPAPVPDPSGPESGQSLAAAVADLPVLDASGRRVLFGALFRERRAVVVFVRHFLCYICKEYVEDLAKIPKSFLQEANVTLIVIGQSSYHHIEPFCKLTGYSHEIYVDPEREIYKRLGMKRGEETTSSGNNIHFIHCDRNRLDHKHINSVLQLVGVQHVDFTSRPSVIHV
ncbi:peroxiredoxin-like 2C isoform X4 [Delphinapterus leucas]|uniref:Peroxiredoxin-like 2C isoform X4 n=1 Tax=Delphinapterus leucas TaxID=9749 RepID=A0A2Y9M0Q5_DELLE|nr:peroxiredoxin-like 2C isoform X4 [Delphinapterus leucas]